MQPSNNTSMLNVQHCPENTQFKMLPSSITTLDNVRHDYLTPNNSYPPKFDTKDKNDIHIVQQQECFSEVTRKEYFSEMLNRLSLQYISLPSLPLLFRHDNVVSNNEDTIQNHSSKKNSFPKERENVDNSTFRHPQFKNILKVFSLSKSANNKMSAAMKSYLMMLVLLLISNMAGKQF